MSLCAAELYHRDGPLPIVVTGGSPGGRGRVAVAPLMGDLLERLGVEARDIVIEGDSTTTFENARETARLLEERGWLVRGNHEDYVISYAYPDPAFFGGPEFELYQSAYWTYRQLGGDVFRPWRPCRFRSTWPRRVTIRPGRGSIVHASMHNNRDGIFPEQPSRNWTKKSTCPINRHRLCFVQPIPTAIDASRWRYAGGQCWFGRATF